MVLFNIGFYLVVPFLAVHISEQLHQAAWAATLQALAQLVIPQQDLTGTAGVQAGQAADAVDYSPWNCVPGFRPIGRMSRARRRVYEASAEHRKAITR
jgi:hypothetical protein